MSKFKLPIQSAKSVLLGVLSGKFEIALREKFTKELHDIIESHIKLLIKESTEDDKKKQVIDMAKVDYQGLVETLCKVLHATADSIRGDDGTYGSTKQ